MNKHWLYNGILLAPDADDNAGGGVTTEVEDTQQTTTTEVQAGDSQPAGEVADVMAEFASAGLLPEVGSEKKALPEPVVHPQSKAGAAKPAANQDTGKKVDDTVEKKEEPIDVFAEIAKRKAGTDNQQQQQANQQQPAPKKKSVEARNYEADLPEEYRDVARNMSNDAYAKFVEVVKKVDTLEKDRTVKSESGVPVSYFEHPDSYLLSPEFAEATSLVRNADAVLAHWEAQKAKIAAGEDWQDLDYVDGKIVLGAIRPANEDSKFKIGQYVNHASSQRNKAVQAATEIKRTFSEKSKALVTWLREQEEKHLPMFKDEKAPVWKTAKEVLQQLPPELRHSPLASSLAKTVAVNRELTGFVKMMLANEADYKRQIAELSGRPAGSLKSQGNNGIVNGNGTSGGRSGGNGVPKGDVSLEEVAAEFKEFL